MDRLVYSPSIKCWVKSDTGVVDLSPYVTQCSIVRKIGDISSAEIHFRNPKVVGPNNKPRFLFTEHETDGKVLPVFHPMDPITIVLERIAGRPIQVFTGYCDTTPYVQLFPGTARITASCTLKRLNFTYWDPALNFVRDFMSKYGWQLGVTGQVQNQKEGTKAENPDQVPTKSVNMTDGSIANLLYATLNEVGGWNDKNIYIQPLPNNIAKLVAGIFDEFSKDNKEVNQEITDLIRRTIGEGDYGSYTQSNTGPSGDSSSGTTSTVSSTGSVENGPGNPNANAHIVSHWPLAVRGSYRGDDPAAHRANLQSHGAADTWQSWNAVDIFVAKGTKTLAVDDGTVHYIHGHYTPGGGPLNGIISYLRTADNEWFYQHQTHVIVPDGHAVKAGQHIGYSGDANGAEHLHIACMNGNPVKLLGLG